MNKTLISVLFAAAALFTASCSDDDNPDLPQITDITFTAQYPAFDSDLIAPQWREMESILFFSEGLTPATSYYLSHSDKPAPAAEFRYSRGGDITLWDYFAGFHGYGYGTLDKFKAEVYPTQKYIPNTTDAEEDMLITPACKVETVDFTREVSLEMHRITAVAAIDIIDATTGLLFHGRDITRVVIDTEDTANNFAGSVMINFYDGTSAITGRCTPKEAVPAGNSRVAADSGDRIMINVLPVSLPAGSEIKVQIEAGGYSAHKTISTTADVSFGSGTITPLTITITDNDLTH